jgi:hypothetical protein
MAFDPLSFNAESVITASLGDINALSLEEGEVPTSAQGQDALRRLNAMISGWSIHALAIPFIQREVFNVTANVGTYTIGPGGDFDTIRPTSLEGAGLLLNSSSPPVEIPRALLTDDAYELIQVKDLTSNQWTSVYYNPTFEDDLATIILWPIPTTAGNDLVLYRKEAVQGFPNLSTPQSFPPGYFEAFEYNLALRLCIPYSKPASGDLRQQAAQAFATIKRQNYKLNDAYLDPGLTMTRRYGYNIQTGQGG